MIDWFTAVSLSSALGEYSNTLAHWHILLHYSLTPKCIELFIVFIFELQTIKYNSSLQIKANSQTEILTHWIWVSRRWRWPLVTWSDKSSECEGRRWTRKPSVWGGSRTNNTYIYILYNLHMVLHFQIYISIQHIPKTSKNLYTLLILCKSSWQRLRNDLFEI